MIVSHRLKWGFLRAPKTGTSTAEFMLRMTDVFSEEDGDVASGLPGLGEFPALTVPCMAAARLAGNEEFMKYQKYGPHCYLSTLIEEKIVPEDRIDDYEIYAYLRNPYERWVSSCAHQLNQFPDIDMIDDFAEKLKEGLEKRNPALFWEQSRHFKYKGQVITKPLDFRDYQKELRRMIDRIGGQQPPVIPRMNQSGKYLRAKVETEDIDIWTEPMLQQIEDVYAEDIEMYESFYGKLERPIPTREPTRKVA